MFKQLFLSTALATAFAATPVLADKHGNKNADDPEDNSQGVTKTYDDVERGDKKIVPDKKAYEKDSKMDKGNQQHPAHEMGAGDETPYEGQ